MFFEVLVGSDRQLSARFLSLATHTCWLSPALKQATTKVESKHLRKGIRWQQLVPIPSGPNLEKVSEDSILRLDEGANSRRNDQGQTVAERFATEFSSSLPLPIVRIHDSADRAQRMIRDVLDCTVARLGDGIRLNVALCHVGTLVSQLEEEIQVTHQFAFACGAREMPKVCRSAIGGCSCYKIWLRTLCSTALAIRPSLLPARPMRTLLLSVFTMIAVR